MMREVLAVHLFSLNCLQILCLRFSLSRCDQSERPFEVTDLEATALRFFCNRNGRALVIRCQFKAHRSVCQQSKFASRIEGNFRD